MVVSADTMAPPDEKDYQCLDCGEYPEDCECWKNSQDYKEYLADQKYDEQQDRLMDERAGND